VAEKDAAVGAGSIAYVAAGVKHHFYDIEEDLSVIVFWAPPWHTNAPR
jgi:mannose-6-phosphate isomerase-like protein (cupin superfamily)